ncbi:aminoacetone oxidase family FAD-binding enzyme [bacterium]|nr:aminoacetone oxidase family FAD-binding enzyme [bacterium]
MPDKYDVVIIGGGAAGFFCAANLIKNNSKLSVLIIERGKEVLQKVKISGGGRCNVTNACWEPRELVKNYPRGSKELLGPFHKFCTGDTFDWFEREGVALKIEEDNRVFPTTDSSQTIIDCLLASSLQRGVQLLKSANVVEIAPLDKAWKITHSKGHTFGRKLLVATGSSKAVWDMLQQLGHQLVAPVPSLFTFNCKDARLRQLAGLSVENASLSIHALKLKSDGPLLVTHWGLSGPAVLKLSAYGARQLAEVNYRFDLQVNFSARTLDEVSAALEQIKKEQAGKQLGNVPLFQIPKRLWRSILGEELAGQSIASLSASQLMQCAKNITEAFFSVNGKSTFKDEFVTAGGLTLSEVDFRTMQSKLHEGLYFAGEVLDIDAITGGFNFQAAWTTAYIAAAHLANA